MLTKKYTFVEEDGELIFENAEGTQIQWLPGKNLTVKMVTKKQRHKSGRGTRTVTRPEPVDSFFNFFNPPQADEENEDSDENGDVEQLIEADFELGEEFRERLIPRAIDWFTGAAIDLDDVRLPAWRSCEGVGWFFVSGGNLKTDGGDLTYALVCVCVCARVNST